MIGQPENCRLINLVEFAPMENQRSEHCCPVELAPEQ